jgi:hypothetical protein
MGQYTQALTLAWIYRGMISAKYVNMFYFSVMLGWLKLELLAECIKALQELPLIG